MRRTTANATRELPKYVTKRDWGKLIATAALTSSGSAKCPEFAARDQAITALGLYTGLRVSELMDLQMEDLDLAEAGKENLTVVCGKGGKPRKSDLTREPLKYLRAYFELRRSPRCSTNPVFVNQCGQPLDKRTVQRLAREVGKRTGYGWLTPHKWRHSLATHLYEVSDGDLLMVMRQLGHASPETTAIYAKCTDPALRRAMHKL